MNAILSRLGKWSDDAGRLLRDAGLRRAAAVARMALGEIADSEGWSRWEREVLERVLERICRYESDELPAPSGCGARDAVAGFVETLPDSRSRELRDLLALIEAGPLVEAPSGQRDRFTELTGEAADAYLDRWADSSIGVRRGAFQALKSLCAMGYWSRRETWPAIGYSVESNPGIET